MRDNSRSGVRHLNQYSAWFFFIFIMYLHFLQNCENFSYSGGELFQRVIDTADSLSEKDIAQQFMKQICKVWQYGLWSFQAGGTKFESFLPKNQHKYSKEIIEF